MKKLILIIIIILAIYSLYFSAVVPWNRSRAFLNGIKSLPSITSVQEFKDTFQPVLKHNTIGDEEAFKYIANESLKIIYQENTAKDVSMAIVEFLEPYHMSTNVRHLIAMGDIYYIMWRKYMDPEFFAKAEDYYLQAKTIGPKLPPVLYSLLNFYQQTAETEKAKNIAEEILVLWPNAVELKSFVESE